MTWNFKNRTQQGLAGQGAAIKYFTGEGYTVSLPLSDTAPYDLVIDKGEGLLLKVQVKTCRKILRGSPAVKLSTDGGNRSSGNKTKVLDREGIDFLFILLESGTCYLIPSEHIGGVHGLCLGPKYDPFVVE